MPSLAAARQGRGPRWHRWWMRSSVGRPWVVCAALILTVIFAAVCYGQGTDEQGTTTTEPPDPGFKIIVHIDNPEVSIERTRLSKIFLKKLKRWPDKESATPYDLTHDSPVRAAFTRAVHDKSISAVKAYWQRMIFSGRGVPPNELPFEDEAMHRIAAERGTVGYVDSATELLPGIKVLEITE